MSKRISSVVGVAVLLTSALGGISAPVQQAFQPQVVSATQTSSQRLVTQTNPILKQYELAKQTGEFKLSAATRYVMPNETAYKNDQRLAEVVKLVNSEGMDKQLPSKTALPMVYIDSSKRKSDDVMVTLKPVAEITPLSSSKEAYAITINDKGVLIEAASENAAMYALRTIQKLMITNGSLPYGHIVDYPDVAERRLFIDAARKYISKDWLIREIREMSFLGMNTLQIHFSENLGFRIESETDPAIVSAEHLTKAEVREVLAEAKKYGINVIPSFDSPGHVDQILRAHPEYGQVGIDGKHSKSGLDITNPEAVKYIRSLYKEYMELFKGCTDFHIGGDEYMEFDRNPFFSNYMPILNQYAEKKYGPGYNWQDTVAGYINDLAEFVHENGFKPRVWNDGMYYNDNETQPGTAQRQKIKMHDYIGVDYWSNMPWNPSIASVQALKDRGFKDIYNLNSSFFYYVLRPDMPTDGREQHSFDNLNADSKIYNEWTPGKFSGNTLPDNDPVIKGTGIAVWCDKADIVTEDTIYSDIELEMRALASKSWNLKSNTLQPYEQFKIVTDKLGYSAGHVKGSKLLESGEFTTETNTVTFSKMSKLTVDLKDAAHIDWLAGVKATDENGVDVTDKVIFDVSQVDLKKAGHYLVTYTVMLDGQTFTATRDVELTDATKDPVDQDTNKKPGDGNTTTDQKGQGNLPQTGELNNRAFVVLGTALIAALTFVGITYNKKRRS